MKIEKFEADGDSATFTLTGARSGIANALRRGINGSVQCFAIDRITFYENTSPMFDEYIAHRIGLVPIVTPVKGFDEEDTVLFTLEANGPKTVYSGELVSKEKEVKVVHRHVVISAFITAIARRTLYDLAKECYRQNHPMAYCDTDSLCTKAKLPVDPKTLGKLKLEKKMEWAEFVAPKIYRGEGYELNKDGQWEPKLVNKAKGFSLGTGRQAFEKLGQIIAGERIGVQRMTRLRELYRTQKDGTYTTSPFEMLVIKALTFEMLSKRFHYPDGETRPWRVDELRSGDFYPKGFNFDKEFLASLDTTTRAMMAAAV